MSSVPVDTAQIMAALGELRGQSAEMLRRQDRMDGRLDRIEGGLVPKAELPPSRHA